MQAPTLQRAFASGAATPAAAASAPQDVQPAPAAAEPPAGPAKAPEAPATPAEDVILDNPDDATLARYQGDIARTLSAVPGITRAYWLTRATLVIDRSGTDQVVWPQVCSELERYAALRTTRVQLNPRPGSEDAVRWRQCRTM